MLNTTNVLNHDKKPTNVLKITTNYEKLLNFELKIFKTELFIVISIINKVKIMKNH